MRNRFRYRIWIAIETTNQNIKHLVIKRNEFNCSYSDSEMEEWVKNKVKNIVDYYTWYASGKYAILKEDGSYIIGRYIG